MTSYDRWMREAFALARQGEGAVNPNPLVGALVVRDGEVVGRGHHARFGGPHAEPVAIDDAGELAQGATLVVNLEPCCTHGKTPPCTERILRAGIKKVVVGCRDPNPEVNGKGITTLRSAGVEVVAGVLERDARRLNEVFCHFITRGRPFVQLKLALSIDGRIAASSGRSRWISGAASREDAHRLRRRLMAIAVGVGTVVVDDPQLTVRHCAGRSPRRFVLDHSGRIPLDARVVRDGGGVTVVTAGLPPAHQRQLAASGATVWDCPGAGGRIDLDRMLARMAEEGVDSLLVEGGSATATEFLVAEQVNKVSLYVAPLLLGGDAVPAVGALGLATPAEGFRLEEVAVRPMGDDLLVEGYPVRRSGRVALGPS